MKIELAYYLGWSEDSINDLPYDRMLEYHAAITIINIDEQINRIRATTFPKMKESGRKEYESELIRRRRRLLAPTGETVDVAEMAKQQALRMEEYANRKSGNTG